MLDRPQGAAYGLRPKTLATLPTTFAVWKSQFAIRVVACEAGGNIFGIGGSAGGVAIAEQIS
eukprot:1893382-Amphidinium_carterae.2